MLVDGVDDGVLLDYFTTRFKALPVLVYSRCWRLVFVRSTGKSQLHMPNCQLLLIVLFESAHVC